MVKIVGLVGDLIREEEDPWQNREEESVHVTVYHQLNASSVAFTPIVSKCKTNLFRLYPQNPSSGLVSPHARP